MVRRQNGRGRRDGSASNAAAIVRWVVASVDTLHMDHRRIVIYLLEGGAKRAQKGLKRIFFDRKRVAKCYFVALAGL